MASIHLDGNLSQFAKGEKNFEVLADNVKQVFDSLVKLHPSLKPHLQEGIAVAIDGKVCQDAWLESVKPDSEVHIFPGIGGG